jgi:hypothetical protein
MSGTRYGLGEKCEKLYKKVSRVYYLARANDNAIPCILQYLLLDLSKELKKAKT